MYNDRKVVRKSSHYTDDEWGKLHECVGIRVSRPCTALTFGGLNFKFAFHSHCMRLVFALATNGKVYCCGWKGPALSLIHRTERRSQCPYIATSREMTHPTARTQNRPRLLVSTELGRWGAGGKDGESLVSRPAQWYRGWRKKQQTVEWRLNQNI